MKKIFVVFFVLCFFTSVFASDTIHSGDLCDDKNDFCLSGNISFYSDRNKLIQLNMRVTQAPGPGKVEIWFEGTGANHKEWHTYMVFKVRGDASEIVDHTLNVNAYYNVSSWGVDSVRFTPAN